MKNFIPKPILFLSLFCLLFTSYVLGNALRDENMQDSKAATVLDKLNSIYKNSPGVQATFTLTIHIPNNKATQQEGTLYLKGNQYKIILPNQEVYSDEKSVWTYLKDANEVQINDYDPDPSNISPSNMFTLYKNDFYYIKTADETVNGKLSHVIDLSPKDRSRSYFKIRLWIDKKTNLLNKAQIFDKNGYRYIYSIKTINSNASIHDNTFKFDKTKYPGVKVEDLRF
ncbi:MAG: outer membrane lipoprotein carrier protein LolA [Chitinophagales bacterium]|nr:outer membrane lipoprotein carrier protein LolA [Chitinophagales bacterium]